MREQTKAWLLGAGVLGALGVLALRERFDGTVHVGDRLIVPVANLPAGALPALIPAAGLIVLQVRQTEGPTVQGLIVGYLPANAQTVMLSGDLSTAIVLSTALGPIQVRLFDAIALFRDGHLVRASTTGLLP